MNVIAKSPNLRGTTLEKRYFRWMHDNVSCVLTGYRPFEIAHTGGLLEGKGMARKSALWTCLPIRRELHLIEERNRREFWERVGFPDHLDWAARLYDIFEKHDDPLSLLMDMQDRASRGEIIRMLT